MFQHTAARRRLGAGYAANKMGVEVSTHSRPKAAGRQQNHAQAGIPSFNTQPPEGGWIGCMAGAAAQAGFNTQPPEGGWAAGIDDALNPVGFNTQPPEGGWFLERVFAAAQVVFQHTAARRRLGHQRPSERKKMVVSTHSRPKAAGKLPSLPRFWTASFNTQPPEGGWAWADAAGGRGYHGFNTQPPEGGWGLPVMFNLSLEVSTHSRPKAAGEYNA